MLLSAFLLIRFLSRWLKKLIFHAVRLIFAAPEPPLLFLFIACRIIRAASASIIIFAIADFQLMPLPPLPPLLFSPFRAPLRH